MEQEIEYREQETTKSRPSAGLIGAREAVSVVRRAGASAILAVALVLILAIVPFVVDIDISYVGYFLFISFCYIIIAQGWNLVAGYAGQISLGQHAFFGLGAYTTAMIWHYDLTKTGYYFDPLLMILSGIVPAIYAAVIGVPLLSRLRGDYFALGTLGAGQILVTVFVQAKDITGGANGLRLPSTAFTSMAPYYWVGLVLAILATAVVYAITRSRIGLALRAIREDETSAASHGVDILRYKLLAFAIAAFLAGIGGSLYTYYLFHINPESVISLNWTFYPILICVLGGNGTIAGPIIGAFFVSTLSSFGEVYFKQLHPVLSGVLIILVMKFMPMGIIGVKDAILSRK